jgi:hypothetical protein
MSGDDVCRNYSDEVGGLPVYDAAHCFISPFTTSPQISREISSHILSTLKAAWRCWKHFERLIGIL